MNENIVRVGMGVVTMSEEGRFLFGYRAGTHRPDTWCLPGGHLEHGESFEDCAQREAMEEAGLTLNNIQLLSVRNNFFLESGKHYVTLFFAATAFGQTPQICEPHKLTRWAWYDWDELPQPLFLPYPEEIPRDAIDAYRERYKVKK